MLIQAKMPHEPFNAYVRDGTAGKKLEAILQSIKPEAVYFAEFGGRRTAVFVVDVADASKIPVIAEPWFLTFNADLEFHPCMSPEDLARSGIDAIGRKWS
jgi:hypothetical protein